MRLLAVLLMACGTAHAGDWESKDTALLGGALGLMAIDWAQTRKLTSPENRARDYFERNPTISKYPDVAEINRHFVATMAGTAVIAYALPARYRPLFLGGVIVIESAVVLNNHRIGLRFSF